MLHAIWHILLVMTALTLEFLTWVARRPRTYADAMEAWRSNCPRQSVWEDALLEGLVRVENGATMNESMVVLTPLGEARLGTPA
jgi:hypothetical protein